MKVLWICNIMLPTIARQLGVSYSNREGWLSGLLERVVQERGRNRIELGIAFPVEEDMGDFQRNMQRGRYAAGREHVLPVLRICGKSGYAGDL